MSRTIEVSKEFKSLTEQFPGLEFAAEADLFIAECGIKSVYDQLRCRRISKISLAPLGPSAGGLSIGADQNFTVLLADDLGDGDLIKELGHEMAHTYHFDLSETPPVDVLPPDAYGQIEDFCNAFAAQWFGGVDFFEAVRVARCG